MNLYDNTWQRFPDGSTNLEYDIFEKASNGRTQWRARVCGMENVEIKLRELGSVSMNKFFAARIKADESDRAGLLPALRP